MEGASHHLLLNIGGKVDDEPFHQSVSSVLTVGHSQSKASSVTPQVPELVAYILSKLNASTRNRILNDIPREFEENGNRLPLTDPMLVEEASYMMAQLRRSKTVRANGPVRCQYTLNVR